MVNYVSLSIIFLIILNKLVNYLDQSGAIGTVNNVEEFMMRHNTRKYLIDKLADCRKVRFWVLAYYSELIFQ